MVKGRILKAVLVAIVLAAIAGGAAVVAQRLWGPQTPAATSDAPARAATVPAAAAAADTLRLSKQARQNLGLVARPARPQDYWRTLQIPGVIVDRPGESDRAVTSPVTGVVQEIHAFTGETLRPGQLLFTLRLLSEPVQNAQTELFRATQEAQLLSEQRGRLQSAARSGALAESRLIETDAQIRRQEVLAQASRQDLLSRGLAAEQVSQAATGNFVSTIEILAPLPPSSTSAGRVITQASDLALDAEDRGSASEFMYEVQGLEVEPGQQVEAGKTMATLANHQRLYIEGHAFKREAPLLGRAAAQKWDIEVEFAEASSETWPPLEQKFQIRHLSNAIDPSSRTLSFYIPLENQARAYEEDGQTFVFWRFRPGQRVRLFVPVEKFEDVLVVPSEAVVREGPEAFVFRQNGDLFDRIRVRVLHEDRRNTVIANDGSITPGLYLAQSSAASLNRVLKAQAASGTPASLHVHADGTVHASH